MKMLHLAAIEAAPKWIVCYDFYPYHEPEILECGKNPTSLPEEMTPYF